MSNVSKESSRDSSLNASFSYSVLPQKNFSPAQAFRIKKLLLKLLYCFKSSRFQRHFFILIFLIIILHIIITITKTIRDVHLYFVKHRAVISRVFLPQDLLETIIIVFDQNELFNFINLFSFIFYYSTVSINLSNILAFI